MGDKTRRKNRLSDASSQKHCPKRPSKLPKQTERHFQQSLHLLLFPTRITEESTEKFN